MKLPDKLTNHTKKFFNEKIHPGVLFIASMVLLIIFLFIKNIFILWSFVFFFLVLTLLKRGSIKILPSIILVICITFFALLSPYGKILLKVGSFRITSDALKSGLHRSGILVGMVYISQFAVNTNLHLPGRAGIFLFHVFFWLDQLLAQRISIKPGKIIQTIDARLIEIWNSDTPDDPQS